MSKNILYIGNNLSGKTKYPTALNILTSKLTNEGYNIIIKSNKLNKVLRMLDMIKGVLKHRRTTDYILIDTYSTINFYYAFLISLVSIFYKLKYIPILHGGNLPYRLDKSVKLSNIMFNNSYINIAPSNFLKATFKKYNFNTKTIPNTIDIVKYKFIERKISKPKLFWVRSFKEIYNPLLALKVLLLLRKENIAATLCMVGPFLDNSYDEALLFIRDNNLESFVELTGVLSKEDWHQKSDEFDVFINTTNIDNTPVSVIEAMALGLPVVSTNVGGLPYLIENKKDGLLVEKNNPEAMKNSVISLLDGKYQEISLNARKKAETFDWQVVRTQWLEILK